MLAMTLLKIIRFRTRDGDEGLVESLGREIGTLAAVGNEFAELQVEYQDGEHTGVRTLDVVKLCYGQALLALVGFYGRGMEDHKADVVLCNLRHLVQDEPDDSQIMVSSYHAEFFGEGIGSHPGFVFTYALAVARLVASAAAARSLSRAEQLMHRLAVLAQERPAAPDLPMVVALAASAMALGYWTLGDRSRACESLSVHQEALVRTETRERVRGLMTESGRRAFDEAWAWCANVWLH
jgi:hypothetical protein